MNLDQLMSEAAKVALAEREKYETYCLTDQCRIVTCDGQEIIRDEWDVGAGWADIYIERRALSSVFRYMTENVARCDELNYAVSGEVFPSRDGEPHMSSHVEHIAPALFKALFGEVGNRAKSVHGKGQR